MFIEQIVCRKNPEYIPRIAGPTDRSPLVTLGLSNKPSKLDTDPTLSLSKLEKYFAILLL